MGLLDGLEKFGLKNISTENMYEEQEKKPVVEEKKEEKKAVNLDETDYIFPKKYECPVCGSSFTSLQVKTGKVRMISMDKDSRPVFDGIEPIKYEAVMCPTCGYSVMSKFFKPLTPSQKKGVIDNVSKNFTKKKEMKDTYSFDDALERISMALACAIVKYGKPSEKAYICLKGGWLCRAYAESLDGTEEDYDSKILELKEKEKEFLDNAYEGFVNARQTETFPLAGMDEPTLDYILAVLAMENGQLEVSAKLIAGILQSVSANSRVKDKARDIKEELVVKIREKKAKGQ
ncbi:MAG: DUF2225 domain-containing protein [Lachnospiraceae bacterium]|nr:DUF2225 domain-containing protein [Lachnospiraceae bacterium]